MTFSKLVGEAQIQVLEKNRAALGKVRGCLETPTTWEDPGRAGCESVLDAFRQAIVPAYHQARIHLGLAIASHPASPVAASTLSHQMNAELTPPTGWPLPLHWQRLNPSENAEAQRQLSLLRVNVKADFIKAQRAIAARLDEGSLAQLRLLRQIADLDDSKRSGLEPAVWPNYATFEASALSRFRYRQKGELIELLYNYPVIAYLRSDHPSPQEARTAVDRLIENNIEETRRVTDLMHRATSASTDPMSVFFALTENPYFVEQVLKKDSSYCDVAEALVSHEKNKRNRRIALTFGAFMVSGIFLPATVTTAAAVGVSAWDATLAGDRFAVKSRQALSTLVGGSSGVSMTDALEAGQEELMMWFLSPLALAGTPVFSQAGTTVLKHLAR